MAQTITIDLTPDGRRIFQRPYLHFSQGDVGQEFVINLKSRFGLTIPAGATVKIEATKPSGFGFSETGVLSDGTATFTTAAIMTDEAGHFPVELSITASGKVLGTANFNFMVERDPHPEGTTDGQAEEVIPELTQLVERVEDAASSVLDRQTVTNTLPAGSQASYSFDEETNTQTFGIPQGEAGAGAVDVTASAYSSSNTYAVGDYVIHNNYLYRCTTAITTAEAWTAGHWTQVLLGDEVSDVKSAITKYNAYDVFSGKVTKTSGTSNGFTFTWSGDICTVTGSASGYGANILIASTALPLDVIPNKKYYVKYTTTDAKVRLRIIWRTASNTEIRTDYFAEDGTVTVPATAEKWTASLFIGNTVTLDNPVTVSGIAMLNTYSNAELLSLIQALPSDYFSAKGVLTTGSDLNDVKNPGYYVLSSGYTYSHSPIASGVAGILVVFPATANSIEQVIYTMGEPVAVKVYARSAIGGSFSFEWKEVSGEQFVNEYVSEHYENTYNITCSPTITTDTNNYLASTGDNTDRTGDIQTMLNTTGVCHLGAGKFVVKGVEVPDYGSLIGSGIRTVIVLDSSVDDGYAVKLGTQSSVSNLRVNGGSTAQNTSATVGTRHGIIFQGTKVSGQSGGTTEKRSTIDHCHITNFSGGGITCTGTGVDLDSNLLISDCFVDHCCVGLNIPYYSEFHRIVNCAFTYNWYGCIDNGGNNNFANCDFSGNKIGLLIDNSTDQSPNVAHGSFTNCSVNHSYSDGGVINEGTAIKLLKANLGEIFTGMQIFYGAIVIDDCVGIRFIGANVGSKVPITITDSTVVTFTDCTFKEAPDHADSIFTQSGNTVLKFRDCYLRNGMAYDPMN